MRGAVILIAGGAGYIGSHMVKLLRLRGHAVLVLDNLSTGHEDMKMHYWTPRWLRGLLVTPLY